MEILMRRTMGGFEVHPEGEGPDALRKIALGTVLPVEFKDPRRRSTQHHRWFFALLNKIFANQEYFKSVDHLRHALLIRLGHYDEVKLKDGRVMQIPHSMAFHKMPRDEFEKFAADAVKFLTEEVIPGLGADDLRREVEEMLA